jgi:predicted RNase H-like HicB family nuclease
MIVPLLSIHILSGSTMFKPFKIIIEKHIDGYIAYPIGLKGVVVAVGESYEEALTDITSAIQFHIETFGQEAFEQQEETLEAFVAEARVAI